MEHKKEHARFDWTEMICKSWTYARLTPDERKRFFMSVDNAEKCGELKGDYHTRWGILNALYHTYLVALGYSFVGWRDKEGEEQQW